MSHLTKGLVAVVFVVGLSIVNVGTAFGLGTWKIDVAAPNSLINSRQFNIEFTTLSTDPNDTIDVELFQNGVGIGSESTTAPYGDSGDFAVTVPSDGTYQYFVRGTNGSETKDSPVKVVKVDTIVTSSPTYGNVTRNGNVYTVSFTAPSDSDVVEVRLFSSTSNNFTANASTQVGSVSVTPGQPSSITYTAVDGANRFHAVQAFDSAGNGSNLVGDPNVVVTQGLGVPGGGANVGGQAAAQGASDQGGQTDASGSSTDDKKGDALGETDKNDNTDSVVAWIIIGVALALILAYANRDKLAKVLKRGEK